MTEFVKCVACQEMRRRPGQYLCSRDWFQLPAAARRALWKKDEKASFRLQELMRQINDGVPLSEIRITP